MNTTTPRARRTEKEGDVTEQRIYAASSGTCPGCGMDIEHEMYEAYRDVKADEFESGCQWCKMSLRVEVEHLPTFRCSMAAPPAVGVADH